MMNKLTIWGAALVGAFLLAIPQHSYAQDFVYTPRNPAFGGSPVNYSWMLSSANAQNLYKKGGTGFGFNRNPLQNFERRLQRQILSSLVRKIIDKRFGNINLKKQTSYRFGNFSIDIFPGAGGINIVIVNTATGERTTVTIPSYQ